MIRPMPKNFGVGFCSNVALPKDVQRGLRYEQVGRFHNYHFTNTDHHWPHGFEIPGAATVDGFSPNLNKKLHVGHLRNLAVAKSMSVIRHKDHMVSLLGRAIGVMDGAADELAAWFEFIGYKPEIFFDDDVSSEIEIKGIPGSGEFDGCLVWIPGLLAMREDQIKPSVIRRSDGTPTYAYHDLAFAELVHPDYYITGMEQKEHFSVLGFGQKHLPMGLVLDATTGKKLKSRDGTAMTADEVMSMVMANLLPTSEPRKLAWNILACNFLNVGRTSDIKFNPSEWTRPDSPGLYMTYAYARIFSAMQKVKHDRLSQSDITELDLTILGTVAYGEYYYNQSVVQMDPSPLAKYGVELARALNAAYNTEKIIDGREAYKSSMYYGLHHLGRVLECLGMFKLESI